MGRRYDFDLIVIWGGIAGFVSAVTANGLGQRVAIVEKRKVGGLEKARERVLYDMAMRRALAWGVPCLGRRGAREVPEDNRRSERKSTRARNGTSTTAPRSMKAHGPHLFE